MRYLHCVNDGKLIDFHVVTYNYMYKREQNNVISMPVCPKNE